MYFNLFITFKSSVLLPGLLVAQTHGLDYPPHLDNLNNATISGHITCQEGPQTGGDIVVKKCVDNGRVFYRSELR